MEGKVKDLVERVKGLKEFASDNSDWLRALEELVSSGMEGVFEVYLKGASPEVLRTFLNELLKVDFERLRHHRDLLLKHLSGSGARKFAPEDADDVQPEGVEGGDETTGMRSLEEGEWACFTLAGGSGTRFFSALPEDSPLRGLKSKGLFPITPEGGHSFLEVFAGEILSLGVECGRLPLWVLMVSGVTEAEIKQFVDSSPWGMPRERILLLRQAEHPRLDHQGLLVVMPDGRLVWAGDGHGGLYFALLRGGESSLQKKLLEMGVKYGVLHNVDNLLARPLYPGRLGFHLRKSASFTLSSAPRRDSSEKMGVVVFLRKERRYYIMEYSVADPAIYTRAREDGTLLFNAGHINTNLFNLEDISTEIEPTLYTHKPLRIGEKKVMTSTLEYLNQSLVARLDPRKVAVCGVKREEFFSPTKSLKGQDSAETSRENYVQFARKVIQRLWGADVKRAEVCEFAPYLLFNENLLRKSLSLEGSVFEAGSHFYWGAVSFKGEGGCRGLKLGKDARFVVKTEAPFGHLTVDSKGNLKWDESLLPKVKVGIGVLVEDGADVEISLEPGAEVTIPDGTRLKGRVKIHAREGERVVLKG